MRLLYSEKKKIPVIVLDDFNNRMIFSINTEHPEKGFKYLCVNGRTTTTVVTSGAKAKRKRTVKAIEDVAFTVDMNIKRSNGSLPKNAKDIGLTPVMVGYLRKTLSLLIDDEGYFPRENLQTLEKILEKVNGCDTDEWDDDPTATESFDDD